MIKKNLLFVSILFCFFCADIIFANTRQINFSLLTYNIAGLPNFISGSNPATNTKLISPLLNNYDIVLVQEDFIYHRDLISKVTHKFRSEVDCDLYAAGKISTKKNGPHCWVGLGDGLNILSRFPIKNFTRETWHDCNGHFDQASDCLTTKGFTFARHELMPGKFIDIYNWHADAGNSSGDIAARRSNITQLFNFIERYSKNNAVIVAGDTNCHYAQTQSMLGVFLKRALLKDAWIELATTTNTQESIDKILYRSSSTVRITPVTYKVEARKFSTAQGAPLSDHAPVAVDFVANII